MTRVSEGESEVSELLSLPLASKPHSVSVGESEVSELLSSSGLQAALTFVASQNWTS